VLSGAGTVQAPCAFYRHFVKDARRRAPGEILLWMRNRLLPKNPRLPSNDATEQP
jgi:hypothetical protein